MRIARDLHDLLGHSLTAITVKAELAGRLGRDVPRPERAAAEIGEVEQLTRQALGDVRAAVAGYREVTLAASWPPPARCSRAAGIAADLPGAVDEVPAELRELFGWVVREGRHQRRSGTPRATRAADRASTPSSVEIIDDGAGVPADAPPGSGLDRAGASAGRGRAGGSRRGRRPAAGTGCALAVAGRARRRRRRRRPRSAGEAG